MPMLFFALLAFTKNRALANTAVSLGCAHIATGESNGWLDSGTQQEHFSVKISMPRWQPMAHVTLRWPDYINVDKCYGATMLNNPGGTGKEVTVELGVQQNKPNNPGMLPSFVLMGRGSKSMPTNASCSGFHDDDESNADTKLAGGSCSLGAHWLITNPYPQLSDAKVQLDRWIAGRTIILTFRGDELGVTNPRHAKWSGTVTSDGDTTISFVLGALGTDYVCQSGHVGADGKMVRDTYCPGEGHEPPYVGFQLHPGPKNPPDIDCPEPSPPMAPGSLSASTLPPLMLPMWFNPPPPHPIMRQVPVQQKWSPPPPPPPAVHASAECLAGGVASIMAVLDSGDQKAWRIQVKPSYMWPTGYAYIVGLHGEQLQVDHTEGAQLVAELNDAADGNQVHKMVFVPSPLNPTFDFYVRGSDLQLASLTCRLQSSPSPPPYTAVPPPPSDNSLSAIFHAISSYKSNYMGYSTQQLAAGAAAALIGLLICICSAVRAFRRRMTGRSIPVSSGGKSRRSRSKKGHHRLGVELESVDVDEPEEDDEEDCWSVVLLIGGREVDVPLPIASVSNMLELQEAIAAIAVQTLGPDVAPEEWVDGYFDTMRIQYLTAQARMATVHEVSATNEAGLRFLEENKSKEGVIILPSGLQYKVLRSGHGDSHPMVDSVCDVHYELRTAQNHPSGDTIDSSYARGEPTSFAPNQVIKGWTEVMQLMVEGDKWEVYLPSELGYGDGGRPPIIGGGDCLIFTMEIIKINGGKVYFEGPKGEERKVRTKLPNGYVQLYEGPTGEERLVRAELPDGSVLHYLGLQGKERKVRGELIDGSVMHLEGLKDEERMVRIERPDGAVEHYEGPRSDTRLVRTEYPDGSIRGIDHDEI